MKKNFVWLSIGLLLASTIACQSTFTLGERNVATETVAEEVAVPTVFAINPAPTDHATIMNTPNQTEETLVALYEKVNPGVVAIQTLTSDGGGLGSGFVYDKEGHIITNYHVVEGAEDLEVDFPSGYKVRGEVIATDLDSDLAIIKTNADPDILTPLPLGDSDLTQIGQTVVAIGNPFGLDSTMTVGIVSAKGRTLSSLRESPEGGVFSAGDIIQTDASINPGNSGGPLLNLSGEVIGINRAIRTNGVNISGEPINSGVGFAISSNIIRRVVPTLIQQGVYDYPYLGVTAREELSLIEQEALNITNQNGEYMSGAYVVEVVDGSPADQSGLIGATKSDTGIPGLLSGGDLIVAIDSHPVRVFGDLLSYLMTNKSPGDQVVITVLRDKQLKEVTITLGRRP